jgi:hypothetical protein
MSKAILQPTPTCAQVAHSGVQTEAVDVGFLPFIQTTLDQPPNGQSVRQPPTAFFVREQAQSRRCRHQRRPPVPA